jgi:hypothetical protein
LTADYPSLHTSFNTVLTSHLDSDSGGFVKQPVETITIFGSIASLGAAAIELNLYLAKIRYYVCSDGAIDCDLVCNQILQTVEDPCCAVVGSLLVHSSILFLGDTGSTPMVSEFMVICETFEAHVNIGQRAWSSVVCFEPFLGALNSGFNIR